MSATRTWTTSIDDLLRTFRDGLIALIPIAERACIAWKEPNAYDDWDIISQALYKAIIITSIEWASDHSALMPIAEYDVRMSTYEDRSFIADKANSKNSAFICFETKGSPFDTCLFAQLDDRRNVIELYERPLQNVEFLFVGRGLNATIFSDVLNVVL